MHAYAYAYCILKYITGVWVVPDVTVRLVAIKVIGIEFFIGFLCMSDLFDLFAARNEVNFNLMNTWRYLLINVLIGGRK